MDAACYLEHSTDTVLCLPGFHLAPVLLHAWYQVYTQFHTSKSSQITPWSRTAALTWLPATCLASKSSVAFKVFSELDIKWPAIINQLCGSAVSGPPGQQSETCALGSPPGVRNVPDPNNGCTAGDVAWKKNQQKLKSCRNEVDNWNSVGDFASMVREASAEEQKPRFSIKMLYDDPRRPQKEDSFTFSWYDLHESNICTRFSLNKHLCLLFVAVYGFTQRVETKVSILFYFFL